MTKTTLYIVRHGKTMFNTIERVQGWCDTPLTKQGQEGIHYLGKGLKDVDFSLLILAIVVVLLKRHVSSSVNMPKEKISLILSIKEFVNGVLAL